MNTAPRHLLPRKHVHDAATWTWKPELALWVGTCRICGSEFPATIAEAQTLVDEHLAQE